MSDNAKDHIFCFIVGVILGLGISFLTMCGVTWAFCFICNLMGISISFSFPLVFALWIIYIVVKSIFKKK